ncbi:cupin domain-containing protein [Mucilaginibacter rubeus]|uniref:Cupin domain-containing protein n=1 Tax=Mucilaginibacter rubeus TaxID=2027860 RepID=A0AAE6MHJ4_9SPHI|nr:MULTISPECIES: cupin domain-containing protein [Mucilaginibacter]QEM03621.1 cupin domain-containing protein [Mucilaginibacter rubeus]QEM16232.1 cupin domain-containing protein [Mucilaginibacter gossypii]QTE41009.1 cupin domain-containing protein [Mucilaginibacter rubeus]QTE47612.1 cupin domain-containing protein [Mucilaginibacter rubeus]QTE59003.1 cupin domain-containing protein [Mucilaginibacter rubeus]
MKQKFWLFGTGVEILSDEKQSGGLYDLIEGTFSPGVETPLHVHNQYSESIYVLEGEFTVYLDEEVIVLKPGETAFIPKGAPHVVAASAPAPSRGITISSPSGFAELIRLTGIPYKPGSDGSEKTDIELFMAVSERLGDAILGPPGARPGNQVN